MTRYIIGRLLQMIPLLLGITLLTYLIIDFVPGGPLADLELNPRTRPADLARIKENLGLDQPWYLRYFAWLGNVVRGDLGISLTDSTSVSGRIFAVLPNTLLLTGSALLFALLFSIPLGVLAAVKRNSPFDHVITVGAVGAYAIPSFWLAFLLIILFGVKFREWGLPGLPVSGAYDFRNGGGFWDRLEHLLLPAISLGLVQLAGWTRYIRSSMLEVTLQDFVRTARAKGLRERVVLSAHAFRNALLPLITIIGLSLPELFGGAYITESVFSWNGMGLLTVNAARGSDYPMIMGTALLFAVLTLVGNLIADILYALLDPRITFD
jgi:peptide/nickel transport system permease protein